MEGHQIKGLMEAYSEVYEPSIITEEVVQQAADMWVEACISHGIDFSEYTLDELTESFIIDMSSEELSESVLNEILGMPSAQNLGAGLRQKFGQARRAVGSAVSKVAGGVKDVAGAGAQGLVGQRTTSKNPLARAANVVTRAQTALPRAAASFATGVLTGKPGSTKPAPAKPAPTGSKPTPDAPAKPAPTGSKPAPAAPAAAAKPAAPAAAAKPAATAAAKPAGSAMDQWAKANPKLAAAKAERDRTRGTSSTTNPLMKDMKSSMPAPKAPAPSTAKTGFDLAKKNVNLAAGVDIFDLVKGHLLDEGYAETEENAIVMMANMSEEWRETIIMELTGGKGHPGYKAGSKDHGPMQDGHPADTMKRRAVGGTMSMRHGYHLDDMDDEDDDEDDYESILKQQARGDRERTRKPLRDKVKAARKKMMTKEDLDQLVEISKELATKAFATRARDAFEMDDIKQHDKADKTKERIVKKHGKKAGDEAEKAAERAIYGHNKYSEAQEREEEKKKSTKKEGIELEDILALNRRMERVYEAQRARENPEDHDKEEKRKYEPVRGERTPMPPRGDKRREEFEKWYAKHVR